MKSFTPQISWHNRDPILSVDLQNRVLSEADGSVSYRLATSGNDSHVIIWKTTVGSKSSTDSTTGAKKWPNVTNECLADLDKHQRPVNVVRFSPNPDHNLLAAGDDDCCVFIWSLRTEDIENELNRMDIKTNPISTTTTKRQTNDFCVKHNDNSDDEDIQVIDPEPTASPSDDPSAAVPVKYVPNPAFVEEVIATEVWKPYKILRGHIQDVSDISWSPDGTRLVSASVDNTAIVWDVLKGQKVHNMNIKHMGFVQGVTWDPLDKYLATLSADRSMRIIDSKTGRIVKRVNKMRTEEEKTSRLFYDDTLRSFCRRLTFTPGGEFLIAPSGILELSDDTNKAGNEDQNKYINTTYVFERKSLNKPTFCLPSNKYTIAVSCCPKLFQLQENLENPFSFAYRVVFAVATQDSVLFYDSQQSLPFARVSQIHYLRLTDISWSPDGRMLIVSSTDGFASFITFEANEIGIPYDGPKHNFEELEEKTSPVPNGKIGSKPVIGTPMETCPTTPEVDKQATAPAKPKESTPSITKFFKKSDTPSTPEVVTKPLGSAQNQTNGATPTAPKGLLFSGKHDSKSVNILVPRKKIKLTPIEPNKPIETIELN